MAMIKDHDYVVILYWDCPFCYKHNGRATVGRYPHGSKLLCQGCAMEMYPANANNVKYEGSDSLPSKEANLDKDTK